MQINMETGRIKYTYNYRAWFIRNNVETGRKKQEMGRKMWKWADKMWILTEQSVNRQQ